MAERQPDALDRIVAAAQREGALDAPGLAAFAAGLRERAELLLAEQVRPLEARLAALERENAWRAESLERLESARVERERELAALGEENERLKAEREDLRGEWQAALGAHGRLLEHHRAVVASLASALEAGVELPAWRAWRLKRRLAELAAELRKELT